MKPKQRKVLQQLLKRIQDSQSLDALRSFNAIDYERELIAPRQFIEDDYYLGKSIKNLSDTWKDVFDEVFAHDSAVGTLVLTGSIGCGKSTFAACCFARKLYELSCLKDPAAFFGLLPRSKIIFGIYNVTLDKADDVTNLIEEYIRESPYFQENCILRERPRYPLYFPSKRLEVSTGSLSTHALGDNVLGFILDEVNFFKKTKGADAATETSRAHQLFNEARTRQVSRFMKAGKVPGLNILISSRKFQSSFLDEFIDKVKSDPELQRLTKVVELALWQTKKASDFCGDSFEVLVGTEHYGSRVLEEDEVMPDGGDTVRVPVEYREQFSMDADLALRDIAGVSTAGSSAYFPVKSKILNCVDKTRLHPFSKPVISIPLGSDATIDEYFQERKLCRISNSAWVPLIHPDSPRHVHIDLAYSEECIGFCMGHPYTMNDGRMGAYLDMVLRIKPPVKGELELGAVVEFVKMLKYTYRFDIKKVTFDQFQSRMPIQLLVQAGFEAEILSVGLPEYVHLKTCLNERRINMYEYEPLITEMDELQRDPEGGRPEHPPGGLDDVTDAVGGVVSRCYNIDHRRKKGSVKKDKVLINSAQAGPIVMGMNMDHGQAEMRDF